MSQAVMSGLERQQLTRIIKQAHTQYLQESALKPSPFNILRVLSAFRKQKQPSPIIYEWIISITKHFNPQNLSQWNRALERISTAAKPNKEEASLILSHSHSHINQKVQDFEEPLLNKQKMIRSNHDSMQELSKEYSAIEIPVRFDCESQQNHYISFDPAHNQNYNMLNFNFKPSPAHYPHPFTKNHDPQRYSVSRLTHNNTQKLKTPVSESLIKNITTCNGSPFLMSKSSQANLQRREPEEYEQFNLTASDWEIMNERANTFLNFTLKFKVISALFAHASVFTSYKSQLLQAENLKISTTQKKVFKLLLKNERNVKEEAAQLKSAQKRYELSLRAKSFKIIKLIYEIRDQKQSIGLGTFFPLNFQFIISLLFSVKEDLFEQTNPLYAKVERFQNAFDFTKIHLILRCFGNNHVTLSEANIQNIIALYHKSIIKRTFAILKHQKQVNQCVSSFRNHKITEKCFDKMKSRWVRAERNKKMIMVGEAKMNGNRLKKAFKILFQEVFSMKIYSKRCEFLEAMRRSHQKTKVMSVWRDLLERQRQRRVEFQKHLNKLESIIISLIQRQTFAKILQCQELNKQRDLHAQFHLHFLQKQSFFKKFIRNHNLFHQEKQVRCKKNSMLAHQALKSWKIKLNKTLSCQLFEKNLQRQILRWSTACFELLLENSQIKFEQEQQKKRSIFKFLISNLQEFREILKEKSVRLTCYLNEQKEKTVHSSLKVSITRFILERIKLSQQAKANLLSNYLKLKHRKQWFWQLQKHHQEQQLQGTKYKAVHQYLTHKKSQKLVASLRKNANYCVSYEFVANFISAQRKHTFCKNMQSEIIDKKCNHLYRKLLQNHLGFFRRTVELSKNIEKTQQTSVLAFVSNNLLKKGFFVLKDLIVRAQQLNIFLGEVNMKQLQKRKKANLKFIVSEAFSRAKSLFEIKSKKMHLSKAHLFFQMRFHHSIIHRAHSLQIHLANQAFLSFTHKIFLSRELLKKHYQSTQFGLKIIKCRFVRRIQKFYVKRLISKKHLFMAIKFRAIQLQSNIFKKWKSLRQIPQFWQKKSKLRVQRLSTDCAFE